MSEQTDIQKATVRLGRDEPRYWVWTSMATQVVLTIRLQLRVKTVGVAGLRDT